MTFKAELTNILRPALGWLVRKLFRVEIHGLAHYHAARAQAANEGRGVLVLCNHVSYLDGFLLYLLLPDPIAFAINTEVVAKPKFRPVLWFAELFVLDPFNPHASKQIIAALKEGRTVGIFPEGRLSDSGGPMKVYDGTALIAKRANAILLPVGIDGTQHGPMTRLGGRVQSRMLPKITLRVLLPEELAGTDKTGGSQAQRQSGTRHIERIMREILFHNVYRDETLPQAVLRASGRHGAGCAVFEDLDRQPLTYRRLFTRSFILAELLAPLTSVGDRVGLLLPNACGTVVSMFALLQRSRVPAMLNIGAGEAVLRQAVATGEIKLVLTSRRFVAAAELGPTVDGLSETTQILYLEDLRAKLTLPLKLKGLLAGRWRRKILEHPECPRDPDAEGCVLFTSGSESAPKGVVLSHRNLLANRAQAGPLLALTRTDLVFASLPIFHSFGLTCGVLLPLLDGSRAFLYPSPLHYRPIPEYCYQLGATVLFGTNTFLSAYGRSAHAFDFQRMRLVIAGAEPLRAQVRALWQEKFGIRIMEGYGLTETSPVLAVNTPLNYRAGSVGLPVALIECRLEPVEGIAAGGRLQVRGPNIMRGYLRHSKPGVLEPPASPLGAGWFDTGDIAEIDTDGFISIVGRAKRFAKIGGEMISLAAVEALALEVSAEHRHAALAVADARKGERIILLTEHAELTRQALIEAGQQMAVSELHVPREVVSVETIPVLRSGKVDYQGVSRLFESLACADVGSGEQPAGAQAPGEQAPTE